jgi:hypothetical protein
MCNSKKRLPSRDEIIPVYATILFPIYSWTIYRLLWNLPSWQKELFSIWDILALGAYGLAFALVESLTVLGFILLLSIALPAKYLRDKFVAQGSAVLWVFFILAIIAQYAIASIVFLSWSIKEYVISSTLILGVSILLLTIAPHFLICRFEKLERFFTSLADRMTIFLFIYLPLGILSLIVVILRNIL